MKNEKTSLASQGDGQSTVILTGGGIFLRPAPPLASGGVCPFTSSPNIRHERSNLDFIETPDAHYSNKQKRS